MITKIAVPNDSPFVNTSRILSISTITEMMVAAILNHSESKNRGFFAMIMLRIVMVTLYQQGDVYVTYLFESKNMEHAAEHCK